MYTVILPAYNEEAVIGKCIAKVKKYNPGAEIIVVSDGSTDRTGEIVKKSGARLLDFKERRGKGISILEGIHAASYENIVFMDADLQYSPKDIPLLIKKLETADLVTVNRISGPREHIYIKIAYKPFVIYFRLPKDSQAGFKAFKKSLVSKINFEEPHINFDLELIIKAHRLRAKTDTLNVHCYEREAGISKFISFRLSIKIFKFLMKMMLDKSV